LSELSLAQVDLEDVLHRLTVHARNLITASTCRAVEEIVLPGGVGPADLASATLLKFLDPGVNTVTWSESKGTATTAGLTAYLRSVMECDYLDLVRSKRYQAAVYPDRDVQDIGANELGGQWFDRLPIRSADPEQEAIRHENTAWLLAHFREEPELEAILQPQLEMDGYNAFTNLELARMLAVSVTEIENRKRRLKTRLKNLAAGQRTKGAKHG
jgi:DNA-directed RNA polymerase specialized sigma24 family protein